MSDENTTAADKDKGNGSVRLATNDLGCDVLVITNGAGGGHDLTLTREGTDCTAAQAKRAHAVAEQAGVRLVELS